MGWEPLLEGVVVCLAREMKAWSDGMALDTGSGRLGIGKQWRCWLNGAGSFVPPPLPFPCRSLCLLVRIKATGGVA